MLTLRPFRFAKILNTGGAIDLRSAVSIAPFSTRVFEEAMRGRIAYNIVGGFSFYERMEGRIRRVSNSL